MGRLRLDSISDFAREGYNIRIKCEACSHTTDANAVQMMAELHRRRSSQLIAKVERRFRCRECGHRGAKVSPIYRNF